MEYRDLMGLQDVFLIGITEPKVNSLRLFFSKSKTSEVPEPLIIGEKNFGDSYLISSDESHPILQIDFDTYIGYSIRNESFTSWDEYEEFEGKIFRIYTKSRYLDFIRAGSFASEDYPGPYNHYGICCLDHIVDIVSVSQPIVSEVERMESSG